MTGNIGFTKLKELALSLRDTYRLTTFIETGTYKAQTTAWAVENFEKVVSIEADESWHEKAKAALGETPRLILGDSAVELPKVIRRLKKPCLIWLDAHWCKDKDADLPECPLLAELAAIKESGVRHFILIDDARLFVTPPGKPHKAADWPTIAQVREALPEGYENLIWNDAIIAVPAEAIDLVWRFTSPPVMEPVILTSNLYLRCLPPFAYLFNKFWPNQSAKIVRYEVRPPKLPDNFTNYAIGKQADYTWSGGLLKYLDDHQGELILLMLEDFFINKPVREMAIKGAWSYMLANSNIAKIDLSDDRLKVPHTIHKDTITQSLIQSAPDATFQTSLQAAIWRVDFLRRFLHPDENPWQFEKHGTRRVIAAREAGEFEGLILGFKNPPMSYVNAIGGEGHNPGLWDNKKIPPWMVEELSRKRLM